MSKYYNNKFMCETRLDESLFQNEKFKINYKFRDVNPNEIEALSFYISNIISYENNYKMGYRYNATFNINKNDNDYVIFSDVINELNKAKGTGIIYQVENGIEIFYKEIGDKNIKKWYYQIVVEDLLENEKLIKIVNINKQEIVECYLVDSCFEILNAKNEELTNMGFKPLFKMK